MRYDQFVALLFVIISLGGVICLGQNMDRPETAPAYEELAAIKGIPSLKEVSISGREKTKEIVFTVGSFPNRIEYRSTYPGFNRVYSLVERAVPITVLVEKGKGGTDSGVWQLEQGGELIVEYDSVRERFLKHQERQTAVLMAVFIIVAVTGLAAGICLILSFLFR
ncbi:MAG: hypothetical protein GY754_38595 [bacterium]|nr:hypothetical protein [bacterium]